MGQEGRGYLEQLPRGQKGCVNKMDGLYRNQRGWGKGNARSLGWRVGYATRRILEQVGTEVCWGNLTASVSFDMLIGTSDET